MSLTPKHSDSDLRALLAKAILLALKANYSYSTIGAVRTFSNFAVEVSPELEYDQLRKDTEIFTVWNLADDYFDALLEGFPDVGLLSLSEAKEVLRKWADAAVAGRHEVIETVIEQVNSDSER